MALTRVVGVVVAAVATSLALVEPGHAWVVGPAWRSGRPSSPAPALARSARTRGVVVMMGRKFENNKLKMAKTAAAYTKKASYIGKKILACVKEGGPNVDSNRQLALLIREAQTLGVTKDVVDRNIKKAADPNTAAFKELTYEAYGAGGVGFIINCLSDNNNRAAAQVKDAIKKSKGCKDAAQGSVQFNFERKGRLGLTAELDEEQLIEIAIEAGIDDVELVEPDPDRGDVESIQSVVLTKSDELGAMQAALTEAGFESAGGLANIPMTLVECSAEDYEINLAALEKFQAIEEADSVEHNMLMVDE